MLIKKIIHKFIEHPLTKGMHADDPETTKLRRRIIRDKSFLEKIYREWYRFIFDNIPKPKGFILEIGTGAGFIRECCPKEISDRIITSEVFYLDEMDIILNAEQLPFKDSSLSTIILIDVFHHIPRCRKFIEECRRAIKPGGAILMVEPWVNFCSKLIYSKLHHEPFNPNTKRWEFQTGGPLSCANGALPWIVFKRDISKFNKLYPEFEIVSIKPMMPFSYLLSGGVSMRAFAPGWSYKFIRWMENRFGLIKMSMFAGIVLIKR